MLLPESSLTHDVECYDAHTLRLRSGREVRDGEAQVGPRVQRWDTSEWDLNTYRLFSGYLVATDSYMNLQLANTEEFIDGTQTGNLGEVLVRCNNVLYIKAAEEDNEKMAE